MILLKSKYNTDNYKNDIFVIKLITIQKLDKHVIEKQTFVLFLKNNFIKYNVKTLRFDISS